MSRSYLPKLLLASLTAPLVMWSAACAPRIGDSCESSQECPVGAICDVTAPRGYCVLRDCDAESCPDGSVCVDFDDESFCVEYCEANDECRQKDGYVCRDDRGPAGFCYMPE